VLTTAFLIIFPSFESEEDVEDVKESNKMNKDKFKSKPPSNKLINVNTYKINPTKINKA
jgi:hypothetical protein